MKDRKRQKELDDTQIRRDTQVRGSLGKRPSGLTDEQWREQEGDEAQANEQGHEQSDLDDDDRMSER